MNNIIEHLDFDSTNFKEQFTNNLISFAKVVQHNIFETQELDCSQSDTIMVGAISEIYLKCEYETTLEMHFHFTYGNLTKENLVHQVITQSNIKSENINSLFSSQPNIVNILNAFECLYFKQDYKTREFLSSFVNKFSFTKGEVDYEELLKEFYPQYEKQILEEHIADTQQSKKIKL
jgi:hypothetical protein